MARPGYAPSGPRLLNIDGSATRTITFCSTTDANVAFGMVGQEADAGEVADCLNQLNNRLLALEQLLCIVRAKSQQITY